MSKSYECFNLKTVNMVVSCTVCMNNFSKNKNISFFNYPRDSTRRQEWLIAVGREDLLSKLVEEKTRQMYRICEEHFEKSCIIFSKNRTVKYLLPNAFPTLKLPTNDGACSGMKQCENVSIQNQSIQFVPVTEISSSSNDLLISKDTTLRSPWQHGLSMTNGTPLNRAVICSSQSEYDIYNSEQGTIEDDWCTPAALRVCKLCLSMDSKMYQLKNNYGLAKMYQDIMGIAPRTDADNRLPMGICWECTARLQSAASFRSKALYSDALLLDHLKNNADLTITDIRNLHRQHTNLKPTMAVQEVFKFNSHNADEHAPNTLIKSEVIGIPHNEEIEVEVGNLVSEKITIKDEGNNEIIEEINPNGDVKTEIDLIPITEMDVDREDFEDFSEDDCRIVKENVYVNEMKVSLDNIVLFKSEGSTYNNKINLKLGQKGKDIYSDDDDERIDFIDVDDDAKDANKAVLCKEKNKTDVKKKKVLKRKAKTDGDGVVCVNGKRPKTSDKKNQTKPIKKKKQPYVKPSTPIDENIFTVKPLNHDDLRREILAKRDSNQYIEAPFKCDVCFKGFSTEDKQARHVLKHTEKYGSVKCNICNVRMAKLRDLRAHVKRQHTSEFICKLCPMVTRNKNVALGHMKYHEGNKYECPQCSVVFEKKTTLLNHLRLKHMSACVCELCGYTFVSKIGVEVHKRMRHKVFDKNTEFKGQFCDLCEVKFLTQKAYYRHLRLSSKHISEDDPNRLSNDPSIKQRRIGSYIRDPRSRRPVIRRRDPNTEPAANGPLTCEQCGVVLENFRAYAAHFRHSHPGINRTQYDNTKTPYMCEHCGKFFNSATTLSAHMWVHDGQKRFQCDHCNKSFTMKANLAGHMQQHQGVRRMFDCRVCGKRFTFSYNLTRHMFLHTGLRPFKCDACEKTFRTNGELRSHVDHVHLKKPRPKRVRRKVKKLEMPSLEY